MTMLTPLHMMHLVGGSLAHVCYNQRKDWNIGSRGCMKYPPDDVLTLIDHWARLERRYAICLGMMD